MQILSQASNQVEVYNDQNGATVFFSYKTPVVVINDIGTIFVTTEKYSKTTSKHINGYVGDRGYVGVTQDRINQLIWE